MTDDLFGEPLIAGKQKTAHVSHKLYLALQRMEHERAGGFQNYMREVKTRIVDGEISYDDAFLGRTWRLASCYGRGGWQDVCGLILACVVNADHEELL